MASISNTSDFEPMNGRCYCGLITYTLQKSPIFVNCCHCRNCQQLSGSAFGLNIMIETDHVKVTSETQPVTVYDDDHLPANSSVHVREGGGTRCPNRKCATLMWGNHPKFNEKIIFLRAGTLARADKITPDCHFFVRSKHPWITIPEGARTFDSIPGEKDGPLWSEAGSKRVQAAMAGGGGDK